MTATVADPHNSLSGEPWSVWNELGAPPRMRLEIPADEPSVDGSSAEKFRARPHFHETPQFASAGESQRWLRTHGGLVVRVASAYAGLLAPYTVPAGVTFVHLHAEEMASARTRMLTDADREIWRQSEKAFSEEVWSFLVTANGGFDPVHPTFPRIGSVTMNHCPLTVQGMIERRRRGNPHLYPAYDLPQFVSIDVVRELPRPVNAVTSRDDAERTQKEQLAIMRESLATTNQLLAALMAERTPKTTGKESR
jgi:hypothetical protein